MQHDTHEAAWSGTLDETMDKCFAAMQLNGTTRAPAPPAVQASPPEAQVQVHACGGFPKARLREGHRRQYSNPLTRQVDFSALKARMPQDAFHAFLAHVHAGS